MYGKYREKSHVDHFWELRGYSMLHSMYTMPLLSTIFIQLTVRFDFHLAIFLRNAGLETCLWHCKPFSFQKWFTCNFSLQYLYTIQKTGNEITQTYQLEVVIMIYHQILLTKLQGNV